MKSSNYTTDTHRYIITIFRVVLNYIYNDDVMKDDYISYSDGCRDTDSCSGAGIPCTHACRGLNDTQNKCIFFDFQKFQRLLEFSLELRITTKTDLRASLTESLLDGWTFHWDEIDGKGLKHFCIHKDRECEYLLNMYNLKLDIQGDINIRGKQFDNTVFDLLLDPSRNLTSTGFSF